MKVSAIFLALALLLVSCSSLHTIRNPGADLSRFKHFYVERQLADNRHIDELIVAELKALGHEASAGPLTMMPDSADAIVTYQDDWEWDFKSYLIQLNIKVRDARRERGLAIGSYRQPSAITKSPAEVVHLICASLFKHPVKSR